MSDVLSTLLLFVQLRTEALRLIVRSWLDFPTFATRWEHPAAESETVGEKCPVIVPKWRIPRHLGIFYVR